jgi:hypothetical protein
LILRVLRLGGWQIRQPLLRLLKMQQRLPLLWLLRLVRVRLPLRLLKLLLLRRLRLLWWLLHDVLLNSLLFLRQLRRNRVLLLRWRLLPLLQRLMLRLLLGLL